MMYYQEDAHRVCPALAGMIRGRTLLHCLNYSMSRACGDDSQFQFTGIPKKKYVPRLRG